VVSLIISCKGIKKNFQIIPCTFLYDGNWGDFELIEHEKYHKSMEDGTCSWLGFEISQSIGMFSERDGKRS